MTWLDLAALVRHVAHRNPVSVDFVVPRSMMRQTRDRGRQRRMEMPRYVDGFVMPVPKKSVAAYVKMARKAGKIWREYGALEYTECIADDVKPGKLTSFPQSVKLKPNETVFFAWVTYKSRRDRDRINAKVMTDPRLAGMDPSTMPFDAKRMFFGGFKAMVEL